MCLATFTEIFRMRAIVTTPGEILFPEFALLLYLVKQKLAHRELSTSRYKEIADEVRHMAIAKSSPLNAQ